ncbi:hypothetical protein GGS20DRAFT_590284 [Poronia punctata]|nr:hypothetical protein GGS20DRAFT_590284 [Poronia punctata]
MYHLFELDHSLHIWHLAAVAALLHVFFRCITATKTWLKRTGDIPTVGSLPTWAPGFLQNIAFSKHAGKLLRVGYSRFKHQAFRYVRGQDDAVVLPFALLGELAALPSTVASAHDAISQDLLGSYTGINSIVESRLHHQVIQKKLNPSLSKLAPALEERLCSVLDEHFGHLPQVGESERTSFNPYHFMGAISARLSSYIIVGPDLSKNSDWIELSLKYTESGK